MPDTPDNGLTCECGEVARVHDFTALGQIPKHRIGTGYICPCREFKSAELAKIGKWIDANSNGASLPPSIADAILYVVEGLIRQVNSLDADRVKAEEQIAALKAEYAPAMLPGQLLWADAPSLRDHFAMAALTGLLAKGRQSDPDGSAATHSPLAYAHFAYLLADAMLEERDRKASAAKE